MTTLRKNIVSNSSPQSRAWFVAFWQGTCRFVIKTFYSNFEVTGHEKIPDGVGIIFCANHANALVDPIVIQAATSKQIHPLARSGLFKMPLLKTMLKLLDAVPIYRAQDPGNKMAKNVDSFVKCYEKLGEGKTIMIFPEGVSHSDPTMRKVNTGAARIALGAKKLNGKSPVLVPVGLTFSHKGFFRGDLLVQFGEPVIIGDEENGDDRQSVQAITERVKLGIIKITLNPNSWEELQILTRVERFYAQRHGRDENLDLSEQFDALKYIIKAQRMLLEHEPERVKTLINHLRLYDKLCLCCGIKDYHLSIKYQPGVLLMYILRTLFKVLISLPASLWGKLNNFIPYQLTGKTFLFFAKTLDQYDTYKILAGMVLFPLFWVTQIAIVNYLLGSNWAMTYFISLIISTVVELQMRGKYLRALEDFKTFFLFLRKSQIRDYLASKQNELETELDNLENIADELLAEQKQT